ncbi:hypothetical protein BpHYR1_025867 [Brachionus plicatilis]|uniref:Uncharacterized protein n=1 Tax=Brachionus plicatilis TaxID=10195 RepID=A0A3M7Q3T9_BRAPC|nr:hypothetical protein BpHYR1_025867 [Brachionus plicatilis]
MPEMQTTLSVRMINRKGWLCKLCRFKSSFAASKSHWSRLLTVTWASKRSLSTVLILFERLRLV